MLKLNIFLDTFIVSANFWATAISVIVTKSPGATAKTNFELTVNFVIKINYMKFPLKLTQASDPIQWKLCLHSPTPPKCLKLWTFIESFPLSVVTSRTWFCKSCGEVVGGEDEIFEGIVVVEILEEVDESENKCMYDNA